MGEVVPFLGPAFTATAPPRFDLGAVRSAIATAAANGDGEVAGGGSVSAADVPAPAGAAPAGAEHPALVGAGAATSSSAVGGGEPRAAGAHAPWRVHADGVEWNPNIMPHVQEEFVDVAEVGGFGVLALSADSMDRALEARWRAQASDSGRSP